MPKEAILSSAAVRLIVGLALTAIIGIAGMAFTQVSQGNKIEANENEIERHTPIINSVDVIKRDVAQLAENMKEVREDIKGVRKDMKEDHKEVMDAIKNSNSGG
jgi:5-bromo-4-chloroindolyl phosphate hydrolysis protein